MEQTDRWLIEIFVPLTFNDGTPVPDKMFAEIRQELLDRFGGMTAFTRAPAEGFWRQGGSTSRDQIIILELLVDRLDPAWWDQWRRSVEALLKQERLLIRASKVEML